MKSKSLPAVAWIAIGFASVVALAVGSVHHFQVPADVFMARGFWWMDIAGLLVSTSVWLHRATRTAPVPQPA
jgi:hypothetical protein